ncbi:MAG TPA: hypothetical protein VGN51_09665 [Acidimicrobiia bacterium]
MKPDVDTLSTVPDAPPAAGPDRAFDPPPPAVVVEVLTALVVEVEVAAGEEEPQPVTPIAPHINAAAVTHRLLLFERYRCTALVGLESFMTAFLWLGSSQPVRVPGILVSGCGTRA